MKFSILKKVISEKNFLGEWKNYKNENLLENDEIYFRTDSKIICINSIFIIKNHGYQFIEEAQRNGCIGIIVEKKDVEKINIEIPMIVVENMKEALDKIIKYQTKNKLTIMITGSSGKTTTTRNLSLQINNKIKVNTNFRNYNTFDGAKASIASANDDCESYVYEIGASERNDISNKIKEIFEPYIAICLNIKYSHVANFPQWSDLKKEKLSIGCGKATKYFILPQEYIEETRILYPHLSLIPLENFYPKNIHNHWFLDEVLYDEYINNITQFCIEIYYQDLKLQVQKNFIIQ